MESTRVRMNRLGSNTLLDVPLLSLDEAFERVDAVSAEDLLELVTAFYDATKMSAAAVGKDEGRFRSALEPLSAELAAA